MGDMADDWDDQGITGKVLHDRGECDPLCCPWCGDDEAEMLMECPYCVDGWVRAGDGLTECGECGGTGWY